jgi:peptide deformylase
VVDLPEIVHNPGMDIVIAPASSLLVPSRSVGHVPMEFAVKMARFMQTADGVGLAAPQVGYNIRVIAIHPDQARHGLKPAMVQDGETDVGLVLVNPKVVATSLVYGALIPGEGCLSLPNAPEAKVRRLTEVKLRYSTVAGEEVVEWVTGMLATIVQHEIDHLDGILYPARSKTSGAVYDAYAARHKLDRAKMDWFHRIMLANMETPPLPADYTEDEWRKCCASVDMPEPETTQLWQRIAGFL